MSTTAMTGRQPQSALRAHAHSGRRVDDSAAALSTTVVAAQPVYFPPFSGSSAYRPADPLPHLPSSPWFTQGGGGAVAAAAAPFLPQGSIDGIPFDADAYAAFCRQVEKESKAAARAAARAQREQLQSTGSAGKFAGTPAPLAALQSVVSAYNQPDHALTARASQRKAALSVLHTDRGHKSNRKGHRKQALRVPAEGKAVEEEKQQQPASAGFLPTISSPRSHGSDPATSNSASLPFPFPPPSSFSTPQPPQRPKAHFAAPLSHPPVSAAALSIIRSMPAASPVFSPPFIKSRQLQHIKSLLQTAPTATTASAVPTTDDPSPSAGSVSAEMHASNNYFKQYEATPSEIQSHSRAPSTVITPRSPAQIDARDSERDTTPISPSQPLSAPTSVPTSVPASTAATRTHSRTGSVRSISALSNIAASPTSAASAANRTPRSFNAVPPPAANSAAFLAYKQQKAEAKARAAEEKERAEAERKRKANEDLAARTRIEFEREHQRRLAESEATRTQALEQRLKQQKLEEALIARRTEMAIKHSERHANAKLTEDEQAEAASADSAPAALGEEVMSHADPLLRLCKKGDAAAFEAAVLAHWAHLLHGERFKADQAEREAARIERERKAANQAAIAALLAEKGITPIAPIAPAESEPSRRTPSRKKRTASTDASLVPRPPSETRSPAQADAAAADSESAPGPAASPRATQLISPPTSRRGTQAPGIRAVRTKVETTRAEAMDVVKRVRTTLVNVLNAASAAPSGTASPTAKSRSFFPASTTSEPPPATAAEIESFRRMCAHLDRKDANGSSLLMHAIWRKQPAMVSLLVPFGANVNTQDSLLNTPLHLACQRGQEGALQTLVAAGAKIVPNLRNKLCFELPPSVELRECVRMATALQQAVQAQLYARSSAYSETDINPIDVYVARKTLQLLEQENEQLRKKAAADAAASAAAAAAGSNAATSSTPVPPAADKSAEDRASRRRTASQPASLARRQTSDRRSLGGRPDPSLLQAEAAPAASPVAAESAPAPVAASSASMAAFDSSSLPQQPIVDAQQPHAAPLAIPPADSPAAAESAPAATVAAGTTATTAPATSVRFKITRASDTNDAHTAAHAPAPAAATAQPAQTPAAAASSTEPDIPLSMAAYMSF